MIYKLICFFIGHDFVMDSNEFPVRIIVFLFFGKTMGEGKRAYCKRCKTYQYLDKGGLNI